MLGPDEIWNMLEMGQQMLLASRRLTEVDDLEQSDALIQTAIAYIDRARQEAIKTGMRLGGIQ